MTLNFGPYACTSQKLVLQVCDYAVLGIESRASLKLRRLSANICNAYFVRQVSCSPGHVHTWYYTHVEIRGQPCGVSSLLPTLHGI